MLILYYVLRYFQLYSLRFCRHLVCGKQKIHKVFLSQIWIPIQEILALDTVPWYNFDNFCFTTHARIIILWFTNCFTVLSCRSILCMCFKINYLTLCIFLYIEVFIILFNKCIITLITFLFPSYIYHHQ